MNDERELLEQAVRRFEPEPGLTERIYHRRDRKRRNQRIAAGVVGIAVFVAAVWIVTSIGSLDRSQTSVVPGGDVTGPAETGPAETGPTAPTVASPEWDGFGLPPEGTALSSPVEGQPILEQSYGGEVRLGERTVLCPYGCRKWYHTFRIVYADGRMLWWNNLRGPGSSGPGGGDYVLERRLTPEGVDLVRSGADPHDLPDSAWADPVARPYAPPRYSVCFWANGVRDQSAAPLLPAVDLLPAPAKAVLRGNDPDPLYPGCLVVSTKEARAFSDVLSEEGLEAPPAPVAGGGVTPGDTVDSWLLRGAEPTLAEQVGIYLHPLWPDGDWHHLCCA
jgi:hypothetical protein